MPDQSLEADKKQLRREVLAARAVAHRETGDAAARAVVEPALVLAARLKPAVVSAYVPMRSELDCRPLLKAIAALGIATAVPVMVGKALPLVFRAYRPGDTLEKASFGVEEPLASAPLLVPDLLFVPLAAFDARGYRLGYGGGFYDRTLAGLRAEKPITAIGLAFDCQEVASVPCGPYDQRLEGVLTPSGYRHFPETS